MQAHTKKRRIEESAVVILTSADGTSSRRKVAGPAVRSIWEMAGAGSSQDASGTVPWREVAKDHIKFGEVAFAVRAGRARAGMTQTELAKKLEVGQAYVSDLERGKRTVGKVMAKRLGELLNVSYRVFL
jgi:ribosome-binding protein aMBF1 (putative translation factor)